MEGSTHPPPLLFLLLSDCGMVLHILFLCQVKKQPKNVSPSSMHACNTLILTPIINGAFVMCCIYTFTNNVCVLWLYLTVSDIDGDIVRCRWAESAQNECYGVCQAFPATLDQVSIQPVSLSLIVARRLKHYITLHYCGTLHLHCI